MKRSSINNYIREAEDFLAAVIMKKQVSSILPFETAITMIIFSAGK